MSLKMRLLAIPLTFAVIGLPLGKAEKRGSDGERAAANSAVHLKDVLWVAPADIQTRNLIYGSGGEAHAPHGPFTFVKEDMDGSNPKFVVKDAEGTKWKVKMGAEARPEVVASRFVWAAGYFTYEEYFVAHLKVENMPAHLHRGQKFVAADGSVRDVRLKRSTRGEEKGGTWRWKDEPFAGTPELNGLRTLMALMNNWDLKTVNNVVLEDKKSGERIYMVSDLGATFGTSGLVYPLAKARGNLAAYEHSKFVRKMSGERVDFETPSRPRLVFLFAFPDYFRRVKMESVGRHIPRSDAKILGETLAKLSHSQIRDAFRAAGYSSEDVEGFSKVIEARIRELQKL